MISTGELVRDRNALQLVNQALGLECCEVEECNHERRLEGWKFPVLNWFEILNLPFVQEWPGMLLSSGLGLGVAALDSWRKQCSSHDRRSEAVFMAHGAKCLYFELHL